MRKLASSVKRFFATWICLVSHVMSPLFVVTAGEALSENPELAAHGAAVPAIEILSQPTAYYLAASVSVELEIQARLLNSNATLAYQWERFGTPIPGATDNRLIIQAGPRGSTILYKVLVTAGDLRLYSEDIRVHV